MQRECGNKNASLIHPKPIPGSSVADSADLITPGRAMAPDQPPRTLAARMNQQTAQAGYPMTGGGHGA